MEYGYKHICLAKSCELLWIFRFEISAITKIGKIGVCRKCQTPFKILTSVSEKGRVVDVMLRIGESVSVGDRTIEFTQAKYDEANQRSKDEYTRNCTTSSDG